jgi:hypothetical protein
MTVSQSKSGNVGIYNTLCTGYTWSLLTLLLLRVFLTVGIIGDDASTISLAVFSAGAILLFVLIPLTTGVTFAVSRLWRLFHRLLLAGGLGLVLLDGLQVLLAG